MCRINSMITMYNIAHLCVAKNSTQSSNPRFSIYIFSNKITPFYLREDPMQFFFITPWCKYEHKSPNPYIVITEKPNTHFSNSAHTFKPVTPESCNMNIIFVVTEVTSCDLVMPKAIPNNLFIKSTCSTLYKRPSQISYKLLLKNQMKYFINRDHILDSFTPRELAKLLIILTCTRGTNHILYVLWFRKFSQNQCSC